MKWIVDPVQDVVEKARNDGKKKKRCWIVCQCKKGSFVCGAKESDKKDKKN